MKTKSLKLNLTSEQCYFLACLLTGQLQGDIKGIQRKAINDNIVLLLKKMDIPHFGLYHELVQSIDWDKVKDNKEELLKKFEQISNSMIKKNPSKGLRHWMDLCKVLEKSKN